jgi:hypothetical protein
MGTYAKMEKSTGAFNEIDWPLNAPDMLSAVSAAIYAEPPPAKREEVKIP